MKTTKFKCLLFAMILLSNVTISQTDSLRYYVSDLNWNSFEEGTDYFPKLFLLNSINRVIYLKDSSKVDYLFKQLEDPNKTVPIHIVLTLVFDSLYVGFGRLENFGGSNTMVFKYNGLKWERNYKDNFKGVGDVKKSEIETIIIYWRKRIYSK